MRVQVALGGMSAGRGITGSGGKEAWHCKVHWKRLVGPATAAAGVITMRPRRHIQLLFMGVFPRIEN